MFSIRTIAAWSALALGAVWSGAATAQELTWWAPNWGQARAEQLAKQFEAANPGIKVKIEITVADGLQNRVLAALRASSPPDLIEINNTWTVPFASTGQLLAMDDFIVKSKADLSDIVPAAIAQARFDGKTYSFPYRAESHALIYNKQLYRDAGLDPEKPPVTWKELLEYSKKLTRVDAGGKQLYGYGVNGGGEVVNLVTRLMPQMWMNGGTILTDDGKQVLIDKPEAVAAVEFYTSLFTKEGVSPPSTLQNDGLATRRLFSAGTLAQYQSGQFDLPVIHQENPKLEVGVALLPAPEGKKPVGVLSGWAFIMPKQGKNHEATWKLVNFLTQVEQMGFYTDTFPARSSAMTLPRFQNPELKGFRDMLQYGKPAPITPAWVQVNQIVYDKVQEVLLKKTTAQDAMTAAAKQIQPLLK